MIDRIRHDIQERLEQLLAEAEKLRGALAALDPRERPAPPPPAPATSRRTPRRPRSESAARARRRTAPGATKSKVLAALDNRGAMTAGEVATATGLNRAAMTKAALGAIAAIALATLFLLGLGAAHHTQADRGGLTGVGGLGFLVAFLAFAIVGVLVAARQPRNPIGWLLCLIGSCAGVGLLAYEYADIALFIGDLAEGDVAALLLSVGILPTFSLLGLALLLFPDGRLPSRRWRPAAAAAIVGSATMLVGYALRPGPLDEPFESVANPFGTGSFELMSALVGLGWLLSAVSVGLAGVAMVRRLRIATGVRRQQLKWIALAASVAGVLFVLNFLSWVVAMPLGGGLWNLIFGLTFAGFPVAAGIASLRYRLYDIDVVINRALVYTTLTSTLAGTYLAGILLLQLVLSGVTADNGLAIAGSTLAVAALFQPLRARIQAAVDRRFYRRKYDAARTLAAFGTRLRDEVDLDTLAAELLTVIDDTMQPAHVSLWLRTGAR